MFLNVLQSKIHRASVTDKCIDYEGSITIGKDLLDASGIRINQKVDVVDVNNGSRFSTYVIGGEKKEVCVNGAAARLVEKNDKIIIISYAVINENEYEGHRVKIVKTGPENTILQTLEERC
jgi:aspartate 1-decarboxylase